MIKRIFQRLYADFLLHERFDELASIVSISLKAGYIHETVSGYYVRVQSGSVNPDDRFFIHRTDVDTDPATAWKMFGIFNSSGIKTTFYFRRKTVDVNLMRKLHESGFEVGYHFEEIADFCKDKRSMDAEMVRSAIPELRNRFIANLNTMERLAGFKFTSVASHGDFVNRRIGIPNHALIDQKLLSQTGLLLEAYCPELICTISDYTSDSTYPEFYRSGRSPINAVKADSACVLFLSHPRHWRAAPWINFKDNFQRLKEELLIR